MPTGGTVASSTLHASAGTHSMVMSAANSISVQSTSLSALGTVGANLGVDIWLPAALAGQSNKGNIQAFFTSSNLSLSSYSTTNVQLTTLTPGQFSKINIPLDPTLQGKLSQSGYTDLSIKFIFNLADTSQTFVDNVTFSSGGGGSGGASGTGGSKSNSGGAGGAGGTKAVGGTTGIGGTNAGGASSIGGTKSTGGLTGTGGKATGGISSIGGTKSSGGTSSSGGSKTSGGTSSTGGTVTTGGTKSTGGTVSTGGSKTSGGTSSTGGTVSTGGSKNTGGTVSTGGTKSTGGTTFAPTGGTPATGGNPATGGVIIIPGTGGTPGIGGVSSMGGSTSAGGTLAGGNTSTSSSTTTNVGGSTSVGGSTGTTGVGGNAGSGGGAGTPGLYTFSFQLPAGVNRNQVVFATTGGDLWVDDGVQAVNGSGFASVSAVGGGKVNRIGVATQVQNVWSGGDVTLANNAEVHGSLMTTGVVNPQAGAKIDGTTIQQANLGPLQTISWAVTFPNNTQPAVNLTANQSLPAGGYPEYDIKTSAQLSLSAGTYTFNAMMVEPAGIINIDNSQGPVFIYLQNGFTFRGVVNTTSTQPNILFGIAGTSPVVIDSAFQGIVVAPSASLSLSTTTVGHTGAFFAQSITAHQNTNITLQSLQPINFCGPTDPCSTFCACPVHARPCIGDATCQVGLTCDSTNTCTCSTTCALKQCGDDPANGCGGLCPNLCGNGQTGCKLNTDCPVGSDCFIGGGPKKGFAAGTNICLPRICHDQDPSQPQCGVGSADCGPCPQCVPNCDGKNCGDDGCGGQCGAVPPTQGGTHYACVDGQVVAFDAVESPLGAPSPLQVTHSTDDIGALPGSFAVSARGTAQYTIPIEVPPGRANIQPKLSITRTGTLANGFVGQGWALAGLSKIERCNKTSAQDGITSRVMLTPTAADPYCLDGQRLIRDEKPSNAPTHLYHTEVESYQLIQPFGSDYDLSGKYVGPEGFTVWTKDGLVLTYGALQDSISTLRDAVVTTRGVRRIWNLSRVSDRANNEMDISYKRTLSVSADGTTVTEIYPYTISYGGHGTPGPDANTFIPPDRQVVFYYEDRPDPQHQYVLGELTHSTKRLKTIETSTVSVANAAVQHRIRSRRLRDKPSIVCYPLWR